MEWVTIITAVSAVSAIVVAWTKMFSNLKKEIKTEAANKSRTEANMQLSLNHISTGVEEMRLEQKDQGRRFDALSERVTRVEESSRSAHKRIDRLEGGRL